MIERIIENWLDNASEKSFQIPFCYILASEGHTIIHLTRHCGIEYGKDIITIDPQGEVCVFQLKGAPKKKIKKRQWQQELLGQVHEMVLMPFQHPSINTNAHHKSYLVTNGEIEEEVFQAINILNNGWEQQNQPQYRLHTIVRGQLIERAKKLKDSFIPPDIEDFKVFLEFYLESGDGILSKDKFALLV